MPDYKQSGILRINQILFYFITTIFGVVFIYLLEIGKSMFCLINAWYCNKNDIGLYVWFLEDQSLRFCILSKALVVQIKRGRKEVIIYWKVFSFFKFIYLFYELFFNSLRKPVIKNYSLVFWWFYRLSKQLRRFYGGKSGVNELVLVQHFLFEQFLFGFFVSFFASCSYFFSVFQ